MAPTTTDASTAQKMTNGGVDNSGRTRDYSTLSNADVICAHFMDLDLEVDFAKKSIFGNVTYSLSAEKWRKAQGGGSQLPQYVLDTNGGLSVSAVEAAFVSADVRSSSVSTFGPVPWKLLPSPHAVFGRSLHISLSEELEEQVVAGGEGSVAPIAGDVVLVRITYATSSEAMACQWVSPESTSGKKYPYLFTQCQAIHARSLLPCQDCPSAKCAYRAKIRAPSWSQTLMSAVLVETKTLENAELSKKEFTFAQKVPVPSYLIAIVCGDIVSSKISDRVDVWSEPKDIEKVAYEFAETEEFLQIAEDITGLPYQWGRYDVLSLPPSFPYGGMENPCLTFVTPTLLAGDRSLADVVAHEISHSWTGNVITNCTWEHFWLNEGWTVWLERKIKKEFVRRKESSTSAAEEAYAVAAQVGLAHLTGSVEHFERLKQPEYTRLVPILEGDIDPDDVFSAVPYEKGYNLLNTLEQTVGEEKFLKILVKNYIAKFKFKTITSAEFKTFCMEECFPSGELKSIDWDMWFFAYGMPKMPFSFTSASIAEATTLADSWASNEEEKTEVLEKLATDTHAKWSGWITETRLVFFERLNKQMSTKTSSSWSSEKLALFSTKALAGLLTTQNCELLFQWFQLLLKTPHWKDYEGEITKMLTSQGRMKYTRPLYRSLASADYGVAKKLFEGNRDFYHPICRNIVVKDIASFAPTTTTGTT